jgi:drug/metabolite transporter (DMT)-like permease
VDRRSLFALFAVGALWGASYLFIKIGLDGGLTPAGVVFLRTALAAAALLPIAAHRGGLAGIRPVLPVVVLLAVVQVVLPFMLISGGEQWVSSGLAGVLVASVPIWVALLAPWFDRAESPTRRALAGIVVGLVGVGLVLGVDLGGGGRALLGGVMVVLAGLGYAVGGFMIKRLSRIDAISMVASTMGIAAVLSLPVAALSAPPGLPDLAALAAMLALGVGGTGVAFILFYGLIAEVGPARASLVTYVAPAFAVFYGVVLYGESLTVATVTGLVLIVGGSWLAGRGRAREPAPVRSAHATGDLRAASVADR